MKDHPTPVPSKDLALMRRMGEPHLRYPCTGARMLRDVLRRKGHRELVRRRPCGRPDAPHGDDRGVSHAAYRPTAFHPPDLPVSAAPVDHLTITRPNHVWAAHSTYLPMKRGFVCRRALMDRASRRVIAWRMSNTLATDFCLDAVQEEITRYGRPEIFNTDQGCRFSSRK